MIPVSRPSLGKEELGAIEKVFATGWLGLGATVLEFENKMKHITHGMMRLASGKMGSRKGNVITGESLINDAREAVSKK